MFTGLIESLATVRRIEPDGPGRRLTVAAADILDGVQLGDSIAVNGACLTVVSLAADTLAAFQAGPETLQKTNLGELAAGDRVNLERSLRLGDRVGGHLVQGHVDGVGHIASRRHKGEWELIWFICPPTLAEQMVSKGSVTVDGVSLTVVDVTADGFSVALIPHTLTHTTLGFKSAGASVNLETDLLAKYVWKCLRGEKGVTLEALRKVGFIREND